MNESYITREEFNRLDDKVDGLANRQTRTEEKVDNVEKKLDKIDSNTTWILRIIVGSILLALLGLIIKGGI